MRHLYMLALLTLALIAPARRPGRHAPDAIHPPLPRRTRTTPRVLPTEPEPPDAEPDVALVRPYLIAHERRQAQERADANRLGVAVLMDIAEPADTSAGSSVITENCWSPPAPADDMGELADVVRAYLGTTGAPVAMWHCSVPGCEMSAPRPVAHQCPLIDPARAQRPMAGVAR